MSAPARRTPPSRIEQPVDSRPASGFAPRATGVRERPAPLPPPRLPPPPRLNVGAPVADVPVSGVSASPPPPAHVRFEEMDTASMTLPPELLQALRALAPKRKRPTLVYVLLLALVTVVVAVIANRSMRDFLISEWQLHTSVAIPR